jgi:hypothetical protein
MLGTYLHFCELLASAGSALGQRAGKSCGGTSPSVSCDSNITLLLQQAAENLRRQVPAATTEKDDASRRVTAVEAKLTLLHSAPGSAPGGGGADDSIVRAILT